MKKAIGKLYISRTTVILCTGFGDNEKRFEGVVVQQLDKTSDHRVGNYSNSWTWHPNVFKEFEGTVTINSSDWKEHIELATCNG